MRYYVSYLLFFLLTIHAVYAQLPDTKKKNNPTPNKDFYNIKAPALKYTKPDTSQILFEEEFSDGDGAVPFDPRREQNIVSEDTSTADEGELSVVETAEQLNIDSIWITIAEYYSIWDSRSVNPYKIDGSTFKDTIPITLFDSVSGTAWSMPLGPTYITSEFGMRHPRWHYGTDLKLETGDPVVAAFDGIVRVRMFDAGGYGNYILLRHYNGLETLYGHLSRQDVQVGQIVKAGEKIGLGGSTGRSSGPHLHYEVRYEGNPIDPEFLYDFSGNKLRSNIFELKPEHFKYLKTARKVVYHTVRSGQTLGSISKKYHVSIKTLCQINKITPKTQLRVGRKIRIR